MATHTSRYNLSKPENTDEMQSFMSDYADNMDKIDENLGGGGGSANIVELTQAEYDALPASKLSDNTMYLIKDALSASDAELTHVNGIFVDPTRVLYNNDNISQNPFSYTATEDCYVKAYCRANSTAQFEALIDSVQVGINYNTSANFELFVKKGQVFTLQTNGSVPAWGMRVEVYGIQQGSNVTIIPDYASACYSTAEREVGCWVDGKPLYQRTFHSTGYNIGSTPQTLIAINDIPFDYVTVIKQSAYDPNDDRIYEIPNMAGYSGDRFFGHLYLNKALNPVVFYGSFYSGGATYPQLDFSITLQYTKSTDTAGSGNWTPLGKPTVHYSTDEQVIGTWIDGKPLYERSFKTVLASSPDVNGDSFLVASGISDIDTLVKIDGTVKENNNYAFFGYSGIADANSGWRYSFHLNPDSQLVVWTSNNSQCWIHVANGKAVCTIQYTKTTD